jgi:hypothetical protein
MGGSKLPETGGAANGVLLHMKCHEKAESNRHWAKGDGWLVAQGADPELHPVRMWNGWTWLKADGSHVNVVTDIKESIDLDVVQGISDAIVSGPFTDEPDDSPTTDA